MSSTVLSENTENTCVVCFKNVSIYSIGECDHPVCYECSTRMRVLCRQNECPICRQDMPKVIFTKIVQPFKNIKNNTYLMDKKFKICFDNAEIQSAYSKLLEHVCTICPGRPAFRTFQNLKDHMRKEHELHYCDLCVDNLKIFTGERRCYTRQELAQHRRKGDPDDRSHRGHPLCEFCDQRYMDNDELFRHLRRDHLFCHFCDADGFHRYYSSYDYLRDHFRADHFLCEEGSCMDEKFTSAFRSEIDLKAHRASVHGRTMGKAAAKQARTLELEFTLAPRPRPERGGGGGGGGGRPGQRGRPARDDDHLLGAAGPAHDDFPGPGAAALAPASAAAPRTHCPDEFPTLSGAPAPAPAMAPGPLSRPNGVGGLTIRAVRQPPLAVTDENFPALGGADAAPPPAALNTVRLSVNSERAGDGLSIRVNRRADPHATRLRADDFPSLGASTGPPGGPAPAPPPASSVASGQWLHVDRRGRPRTPLAGPPQGPPPKVKSMQEDFPSLGAPASATEARAKKASSVVIPVTPAPSWLQSNGPVHPPAAAPAPATPAAATSAKQELMGVATIKVKSKKKKQQQQPQQQQQAKNANDGGGKEAGKRKKREDASASASSKSAARSGEEEITSKLEGVLTCKESSGGGGDGRGAGHSSSSSTGSGAASAAAAAAERKRSELLIASLRPERTAPPPSPPESPPPPAIPREDFPSLGCPPGFWRPVLAAAAATAVTTSTSTTAPPPGFGAASATTTASSSTAAAAAAAAAGPPPGFSSVTLNSVARAPAPPGGNGLTFTSSSGRSYPILPRAAPSAGTHTPSPAPAAAAAAPFVPPRDAERRNQALVARVRRVLPLDDFLQLSALFRQGALPAATFRSHCRHLLGEEAFADVFPELLALLPDIAKQQELMAAHEEEEGPGSLPIQVCASCGQVLASGDLRHHQASHHLENHFASTTLDKASTTIASAWDNRK